MSSLQGQVETKVNNLQEDISNIQLKFLDRLKNISVDKSGDTKTWSHGGGDVNPYTLLAEYESWYNKSIPLIEDYLPDRADEFRERYQQVRRGLELDMDYLSENGVSSSDEVGKRVSMALAFQEQLINAIPGRIEFRELKATERVSSDLMSEELEKAKRLLNDRDVRAAGVLAGVAIERHLLTLCESSSQELDFDYMDGITTLSHTLSEAGEISDDHHRLLQYLSGVRNKCSHASDEEPKEAEIERMLNQANSFMQP
ncbi:MULTISPECIES: hypothetical protein [Halobacterium]|uniref:hypothetical protein n=1 Tax=Halobacterium TaxID=2239 RepID=UPI00196579A4|nr:MULTISPECIES: hypothetical protein [Halobacterium]MDL0130852.1 hypothetical protein [Halobacterium salinarum]MDL0136423.1 hypothetical protein [Halobacterium salinarum]MDL0140232.1 hypothetical protein [Halobacterium salinarum]MDL0142378.1 hypothetical protein [Halobacterium salinarum]MDL0144893.1 hypothetical protein [Halobacterium salinarum]